MLLNNRVRKLDFQDLVIFQLIYKHRSVTEVAEQLSVSQSTISYCLKRLRDCFDDELFINSRLGMSPTQRAEALTPRIQSILNQMAECAQEDADFNPNGESSSFTIYAPEYFEILVMPELMKSILEAGYKVSINIKKPEKDLPYDDIVSGQIDLAIFFGPGFYRTYPGLATQTLFRDHLLAAYDGDDQPQALGLEEMMRRRHVFPTPWVSDSNMVDGWLRSQGKRRTIAAKANSYYSAIELLAGSDLLLMLPKRIHERVRRQQPNIGARPGPEGLPDFTLDMVWSAALANNQANVWLRQQLIRACASI
ncbi:LysR family transcriptional regulator [Chromobacterium phragmitis]|uniref:LysR family transcriptional regulator n=1 Tax=Chromobacterium phragmitis TaxID=2202141 RepID=A0A344UG79_9NEIS|nr:LysR family transcriptional regulator [Chromobacterium phragmitis]AXE28917.1 LysR family transcriptional regulator [Chromobacterium phragmitis]AXE34277.1 LysR family transcriptional regulator [Chromobacterium phragmitis]